MIIFPNGLHLLLGVLLAAVGAQAQTAACSLSGQLPDGPFDPQAVEFVPALQPIANGVPAFSVQTIARVAGVRPLVVEVLDNNVADQGGSHTCERRRIYSVDSRLREILPQLGVRDLVKARFVLAYGGTSALVLTEVEKIQGEPSYFHERPEQTVCANRTGALAAYQPATGETLTVYQDGSIDYQDVRGQVFDRQRLTQEEMERFMQSFRTARFDGLTNTLPPADKTQGQPSVTLLCARHQRVLVRGNEAALAPVMESLEQVKAKALAGAYYRLIYDEKREITFLTWPFSQLPVEQAKSKISEAANEEFAARCQVRLVHGDFRMFHQELPHEFFAKLPINYAKHPDRDPNRDAYVKSGSRLYRVSWLACDAEERDCENLYRLSQLVVDEVMTPENLMRTAPNRTPPAAASGCSSLAGIRHVLWPANAGVALGDVPADGQSITPEEYGRHEPLYRELLAAGSCGDGIDFVEGGYWYRNVRMLHLDRAASSR